jgi:hypothetical protein
MSMNALLLSLLVGPHLALGTAWAFWAWSPSRFQPPRWRTILLFSGLLACSLNIAIFWVYLIWLRFHQTDLSWWKGRDNFEGVCDFLVGLALTSAVFGKGRARLPVGIAAVTGFLLWVTGHVGVL